ncbi:hypothetical protein CspHIS471_0103010 [Cutaneotrichosporon sp. HIS471]|nr:hypothetical protein CspHIS471_0103010 [Cutaneotrichosporon sp. HIS471]
MQVQYAIRSQKTTGLVNGPSWEIGSSIATANNATRAVVYSPNGEYVAYAQPESVSLCRAADGLEGQTTTIAQIGVTALAFSPLSSTLFTFERPVKSETEVYKNVKAWSVATGEQIGAWYHKTGDDWEPIVTPDEMHLFRPAGNDILVFTPMLADRPATRFKFDGQVRGVFISRPSQLSAPHGKPLRQYPEAAVAIWIGERKGAPAYVSLYPCSSLVGKGTANGDTDKTENRELPPTVARKAFYKADKLTLKWNHAGTMCLFLTHTDVDNTGKSYYGETNLYLVALDGSFDGMIDLDKEGPIYDFAWNPTSRDFAVCYGYMPARTQTYDHKAKPIFNFGNNHRNFVSYQPQGRLLLSAGFGNLPGGVDVWEISTRKKIAEFKASNSSHCEWSTCGHYILTATLSPRLRVDNGVKIWWAGGQLLHIHPQDDLYGATFRPALVETLPAFPPVVPKAPEANASVAQFRPKGEADSGSGPSKPVGAYRPPGARGSAASLAYVRDDDSAPSSGTSTPMFRGGKPAGRYIPGTAIPGAPSSGASGADKKKKPRNKKKAAPEPEELAADLAKVDLKHDEDTAQKKIRNLTKKLKAIDDLKARVTKGEQLEKTQMQKVETEASVRDEIRALGGDA